MQKNLLKFIVGSLALLIGIAVVWTSSIYQVFFPDAGNYNHPSTELTSTQHSNKEKSGKVLISFKSFEYGKEWIASFEITNDTASPIFYIGSKRKGSLDYCTLAVKREEPFPANPSGITDNSTFKTTDICYYGTFLALQTLHPGESVVLAAEDHTVRDALHIKETKQHTKAQIGFEVFTGDEKRREILWSEEVTFPYDEYR